MIYMFESKQNKRNSKKKSFFSSDKKAGLNIGGGGIRWKAGL